MNRRSRSAQGYDRLAKVYRPLEFCLFGHALQRARVALIGDLPKATEILVLGDGDGRLLEQLCQSQTDGQITSVDHSQVMLDRQRARLEPLGADRRVQFICRDARSFVPAVGKYDLLITAFFLDCFTEVELGKLLPIWLAGLRESGHFYFVDFVRPKSLWRRCQSDVYQSMMHGLFRWQTGLPNRRLVDLDAALAVQTLTLIGSAKDVHPLTACRIYRKHLGD